MKQIYWIAALGLFCGMTTFTSCQRKEDVKPDEKKSSIVILYENDVHCAIDGYAKMAGLRDAISDTAYVGLTSSGDYLMGGTAGALSTGSYIVDIMRTMRYDAVGLGNHEFDFGAPRMLELLKDFNAPVICANFFDMQGNRFFPAYTIREYGERKIAFVGVLTPKTMEDESYSFYDEKGNQLYDLKQSELPQLVQQAVDEVRQAGADYVILLSHLGEKESDSDPTSHALVAATTGIDIVFDGHTHSVIPCDTVLNAAGKPVYISQTGTAFANVGKLLIDSAGGFHIELIPAESITFSNAVVASTTDSIHRLLNAEVNKVVFHSDYRLAIDDGKGTRMVRKAETNAGDLCTDAYRYITKADIAFNNGGGIRANIEAGDVTLKQVIDMQPFDNRIVTIQATGAQILNMLQLCTATLPEEDGAFPQVSGMRFTVRVADHTITSAEVMQPDGTYKPIDPTAVYTIGTTDYCAYNGGFYNAFRQCPIIKEYTTLCRETLTLYIQEVHNGNVPAQYAAPQGRIIIE